VLAQFEELAEFRQAKSGSSDGAEPVSITADDQQTPEERIDRAYRELGSALAAELLDRVSEQSPEFFEQLVLDVVHARATAEVATMPLNG
jgi:restriction system protein